MPDCEIPRTSRGAARRWDAGDRDKLTETTRGKLLFKVLGVSQRKIHHSKEMWHLSLFERLRLFYVVRFQNVSKV
jgi:hypothetical protein